MVGIRGIQLPLLLVLLNAVFASAYRWYNWQYEVTCEADAFVTPKDEAEVAKFLKEEYKHQSFIKVVGNGHGFGNLSTCVDQSLTNKTSYIVSLTNLKDLTINKENNTVTFGAGWDVVDLIAELKKNNLSFNNLGAERVQNFVGATSTGTHGTGAQVGNIGTQVLALRVLDAAGHVRVINEWTNPEELKAFRISLGVLGLITEFTIKVQPTYLLKKTTKVLQATTNYTQLYTDMEKLYQEHDRMTVWGPHFDWDEKVQDWAIEPNFYASWWEPTDYTGPLNCTLDYCANGCGDCIRDYICYDEVTDAMSCPPQGVCTREFYAEIEHFFPIEEFVEVAVKYTQFQQAQTPRMKGYNNLQMIFQFRILKGDDAWMSPVNTYNLGPQNSGVFGVIEIDWMSTVNSWNTLWHDQELAFEFLPEFGYKFNMRSHWNKMAQFDPKFTEYAFPKLPKFLEIQERQDPNCQFINQYLVDTLGIDRCKPTLTL